MKSANSRGLLLLVLVFCGASLSRAGEAGALELRYALIYSRHGVRSPTVSIEDLNQLSQDPWPQWSVAPGLLTPHGHQLMVLMGKYYLDRFGAAGLLSSDAASNEAAIYVASDKVPRTIETARALMEGLVPGQVPAFKLLTSRWNDADHRRAEPPIDPVLARAAIEARTGGHMDELTKAYRGPLLELQEIVRSPRRWMDQPATLSYEDGREKLGGAISTASSLVEDLILEYTDDLSPVGWNRFSRQKLADCYCLHSLSFDLTEETPYLARAKVGNLACRIVSSLSQASSGRPIDGAFGSTSTRLAVIVGHDSQIASLASLFRLSWVADDLPASPTLPGGALVFELWTDSHSTARYVRAYYVAQSLDQMRAGAELSVQHPPTIATLFLPGGTAGKDHQAPLDRFIAESAPGIGYSAN